MSRNKTSKCRPRNRLQPAFDLVEPRILLTTFVVSTTDDSGPGSLRQAILDANANPNAPGNRDVIDFAVPNSGVHGIVPTSDLPTITDPLLLDGSSQLTDAGTPAIALVGVNSGGGDGLTISSANTTIQNLIINQFGGSGIVVQPGATGVLIRANFIGTDPTGTSSAGNGGDGITINATGGIVGGSDFSDANVISGNGSANLGNGVTLNASGNQVLGNLIGTDVNGLISVGNFGNGVIITADNNTIGGTTFADANVISGNQQTGIQIGGSGTPVHGTHVLNNLIGTNFGGAIDRPSAAFTSLPNGFSGVAIGVGASGNVIGMPGAGNLIAGNRLAGIALGSRADSNIIQGNGIGTTRSAGGSVGIGPANLGNGQDGIRITGASGNSIGGSVVGAGNVISGNSGSGINISGNDTARPGNPGNLVLGNVIGMSINSQVSIPNLAGGIRLASSSHNTVGGTGPGQGNLISSNRGAGLTVFGVMSVGNAIFGNEIGTDLTGLRAFGNAGDGIQILDASNTTIGSAAGGNLVAANAGHGLLIAGTGATGNLVRGNIIGLSPANTPLGNTGDGIHISAQNNTIGGASLGDRNVISANQGNGIVVATEVTTLGVLAIAGHTLIEGNFLGPGLGGVVAGQGNEQDGILLKDSSDNTIGVGNVVSGNRQSGIHVTGTSTRDVVRGNIVGLNADGTRGTTGNFVTGVYLQGVSGNTIGGTGSGDGNVLSGNGAIGLLIASGTANLIEGNLVGTDPTGTTLRGNALDGITLSNSPNNTIGGTTPGSRNVISGNGSVGLRILGPGGSNSVIGNLIGVDIQGASPLGNVLDGISISDSPLNTIGGSIPLSGNVVSANGRTGIAISGAGASGTAVQGNRIGTDLAGGLRLGNALDGVLLDSAPNNSVGGNSPGSRNLISANGGNGVEIRNTGASAEVVAGNFIGTDASGSFALGNAQNGLLLETGATGNLIGGGVPGAGNLISGNLGSGVQLFAGATANGIFGNRIGTDATGARGLGNSLTGIAIVDASDNLIGSGPSGAGNLISGNGLNGVALVGSGASRNRVQANLIGTDGSGSLAIGNSTSGISLDNAPGNTIGGDAATEGNVVAANRGFGILLINSGTTGNQISGNFVGTSRSGLSQLGNALDGLLINAAPGNSVGGSIATLGNVFSGNGGNGINIVLTTGGRLDGNFVGVNPTGSRALPNAFDGIAISGSTGIAIAGSARPSVISGNGRDGIDLSGGNSGTTIQGSQIGTDISGRFAIGNHLDGLVLANSNQNLVGGDADGQGNLISGNSGVGIHLVGASGNILKANRVGTAGNSGSALGNRVDGMTLEASPSNVVQGNLISANLGNGVRVVGPGSDSNTIAFNTIGTDIAGIVGLGNGDFGVSLEGASRTLIQADLISGNASAGVGISGLTSSGNRIIASKIGTDRAGGASLSNGYGVFVNGSGSNTIGGVAPGAGNLISGNALAGVHIFGRFASANQVLGNRIGTDASGRQAIAIPGSTPRQQVGVLINEAPALDLNDNSAPGNTIGGVSPTAMNLISGNLVGIEINGTGAKGNVVLGNMIGPTIDGAKGAGNQIGVFLNGAPGNVIGGLAANVISANTSVGVYFLGNPTTGNVVAGNLIGTTPDGHSALGNQVGIYAENAPANTIGGSTAASRNVLSANSVANVYILGGQSVGNAVLGNFIGTDSGGIARLGTQQYGVLLFNAPNNAVIRSGPNTNQITGSSIANFREFTGQTVVANPSGSAGTPKKASIAAQPLVQTRRLIPAGPARLRKTKSSG